MNSDKKEQYNNLLEHSNPVIRERIRDAMKIAWLLSVDQEIFLDQLAGTLVPKWEEELQGKNCKTQTPKLITLSSAPLPDFYVFDARNDKCEKCSSLNGTAVAPADMTESKMRSKGFWLQSDGVYRPHPHCRCVWRTFYLDPQKKMTKRNRPDSIRGERKPNDRSSKRKITLVNAETSKIGLLNKIWGDATFCGIKDLIHKLESMNLEPHSIDVLTIIAHGDGHFFNLGNGENLANCYDKEIEAIKKYLHKDSIVEIRMCATVSGPRGLEGAQNLANRFGCTVLAYGGTTSPITRRAPTNKAQKIKDLEFLPDYKPRVFFPNSNP